MNRMLATNFPLFGLEGGRVVEISDSRRVNGGRGGSVRVPWSVHAIYATHASLEDFLWTMLVPPNGSGEGSDVLHDSIRCGGCSTRSVAPSSPHQPEIRGQSKSIMCVLSGE